MFGAPLGPLLNDVMIIDLINGRGQWGMAKWVRRRLAQWWLYRRGAVRPALPRAAARDAILVTWRASNSRVDDLVVPVIEALGPPRCTVLYENDNVVARTPQGAAHLRLFGVLPHEPEIWRPAFRRCWPAWRAALKNVCRRYGLSPGVYQRLAIELVYGSQFFSGCRQFLEAFRPAAVLTEYDRGSRWSCLVLAARSLGIATFTLQHGVLGDDAIGYVPVIADKVFCWGEMAAENLVRNGVSPEQVAIGGCPRLDRALTATPREARAKLSLDAAQPVIMLATAPYADAERTRLVEIFAASLELLPEVQGIVRLHPSEERASYAKLIQCYPSVRFFESAEASLDESFAATDIVVVHNSGVGSDALVKGRPTIVVEMPPSPLGHGKDLVEMAGCACASSPGELAKAVAALLLDKGQRERHAAAAEQFVGRFCAYFGRESARRIADMVNETIAGTASGPQRDYLEPHKTSVGA